MADARHAKGTAEEAKLVVYTAVSSGVTAAQAIAPRDSFDGTARVLPPHPKRHR